MNYYVKKDLTKIVRAKKANNVFFAMREGARVPELKKEGYMVEFASVSTPGLITREFLSTFEFERDYTLTNLAELDMVTLTSLIASFAAADTTRPTVVSTSPATSATNVAVGATVSVTFSEAIQVIQGQVAAFYHVVDGDWVKIEDATSMTVGGVGDKVLTIGHTAFTNGEVVRCVIPANTVEDKSSNTNNYNTAYTFQFAVIPEQVMTSVPVHEAVDVAVASDLTVNYLNALDDATSTFALTVTAGGAAVPATVTYSTNKRVVTVNPTDNLTAATGYTLTCHAVDIAGQVKDSVITFTTVTE